MYFNIYFIWHLNIHIALALSRFGQGEDIKRLVSQLRTLYSTENMEMHINAEVRMC